MSCLTARALSYKGKTAVGNYEDDSGRGGVSRVNSGKINDFSLLNAHSLKGLTFLIAEKRKNFNFF